MPLSSFHDPVQIAQWDNLLDRTPTGARLESTDLVIVRYDAKVSVLYGRCLHRGAFLEDGYVDDRDNLICGLRNWDYRVDTGVSEYNNSQVLHKFKSVVVHGAAYVNKADVIAFEELHPQPFVRSRYLRQYDDTHPESTEPCTRYIQELSRNGLSNVGHHDPSEAMGVDRDTLPKWEDIQFLPAQLAKPPLLDHEEVGTQVVIGPNAAKPLTLEIPLFVSDMSFGALSREVKIALSQGAELVGTGICIVEGGMLPEEQAGNSRYFYELASAQFGFSYDQVKLAQAFHFKGGQGAKTGTGGHLPGNQVTEEIAAVRGLTPGELAISPATFPDLKGPEAFREVVAEVRVATSGVPVGLKIAASRLEKDIDFALDVGVDYIILDSRGGGTGAAPSILRNNINVLPIPALARARAHLDQRGAKGVALVITGGLRVAEDFAQAMMLGTDAIAVSNSALQALCWLGMRACHTNNCPVGITTQKPHFRERLDIDKLAQQLASFFGATNELIKVVARACGHNHVSQFNFADLSTLNYDIHRLTGIPYAGVRPSTNLN